MMANSKLEMIELECKMKIYIVEGHAWDEESNSTWKIGAYQDKKIAEDKCQKLNETLGDCLMPIVIKYYDEKAYLKREFFDKQDELIKLFEPLIEIDAVLTLNDMSFNIMCCMNYSVTEMEVK